MRTLVTGSSGHLGEALVRALREEGDDTVGLDIVRSEHTDLVGSIVDRAWVGRCLQGVDAVVHTATLHDPHLATQRRGAFVETNVTGTLNLVEAAADAGVRAFVFTNTTSAFGRALTPANGAPTVWITEDVRPLPRNIYGATKVAAEDICELVHRDLAAMPGAPHLSVLPEADDRDDAPASLDALNLKVNELLYRRVDLEDVVTAHRLALDRAGALGFGRYIISATTPFGPGDLAALRHDAAGVVGRLFPDGPPLYARLGWSMLPTIDRVYVNARARTALGWTPRYDFRHALDCLGAGKDPRSATALRVGVKGYHGVATDSSTRY